MAYRYQMQAVDSVTGGLFTWVEMDEPDWAAINYPGPNTATEICVQGRAGDFDNGEGQFASGDTLYSLTAAPYDAEEDAAVANAATFTASRTMPTNNTIYRITWLVSYANAGTWYVADYLAIYKRDSGGTITVLAEAPIIDTVDLTIAAAAGSGLAELDITNDFGFPLQIRAAASVIVEDVS